MQCYYLLTFYDGLTAALTQQHSYRIIVNDETQKDMGAYSFNIGIRIYPDKCLEKTEENYEFSMYSLLGFIALTSFYQHY
jgi:hypothetical protein